MFPIGIWPPYYETDIKAIKNIQRRGSKLEPKVKNLGYEQRQKCSDIASSVYRMSRGDMIKT